MALPQFQSDDQIFQLMQNQWAKELNPLLALPLTNGQLLQGVVLVPGSNTINHKLARKLRGWFFTRQRALASVYDTQDSNPQPALTLTLTSSAATMVDIWVF